jgi:hypothetical protein
VSLNIPELNAITLRDAALQMSAEPESWPLWLGEFVGDFRRSGRPELLSEPPSAAVPEYLRCLLASVAESLCAERGTAAPAWCAQIGALATPWFVSGMENLKAMALVESPAQFRKRNIFVLENFLVRM